MQANVATPNESTQALLRLKVLSEVLMHVGDSVDGVKVVLVKIVTVLC